MRSTSLLLELSVMVMVISHFPDVDIDFKCEISTPKSENTWEMQNIARSGASKEKFNQINDSKMPEKLIPLN
jgi:hypothetical protein